MTGCVRVDADDSRYAIAPGIALESVHPMQGTRP